MPKGQLRGCKAINRVAQTLSVSIGATSLPGHTVGKGRAETDLVFFGVRPPGETATVRAQVGLANLSP